MIVTDFADPWTLLSPAFMV